MSNITLDSWILHQKQKSMYGTMSISEIIQLGADARWVQNKAYTNCLQIWSMNQKKLKTKRKRYTTQNQFTHVKRHKS